MTQKFRRAHLRAPLKTTVLYKDESHVLKANALNISKGGILLENLPHVPKINLMPLMVDLVHYPDFQSLRFDRIHQLATKSFDRTIFRVRAKIVRSFEEESEVDKIFASSIGCQLVDPSDEVEKLITGDVNVFAKNTIFLLGLFENRGSKKEEINRLRFIAGVLGYQKDLPLPKLRQTVLHDYQSLEDL